MNMMDNMFGTKEKRLAIKANKKPKKNQGLIQTISNIVSPTPEKVKQEEKRKYDQMLKEGKTPGSAVWQLDQERQARIKREKEARRKK